MVGKTYSEVSSEHARVQRMQDDAHARSARRIAARTSHASSLMFRATVIGMRGGCPYPSTQPVSNLSMAQ